MDIKTTNEEINLVHQNFNFKIVDIKNGLHQDGPRDTISFSLDSLEILNDLYKKIEFYLYCNGSDFNKIQLYKVKEDLSLGASYLKIKDFDNREWKIYSS